MQEWRFAGVEFIVPDAQASKQALAHTPSRGLVPRTVTLELNLPDAQELTIANELQKRSDKRHTLCVGVLGSSSAGGGEAGSEVVGVQVCHGERIEQIGRV